MKFVVVTGGVISGLGKGITASSIGLLLQMRGWKVSAVKIDPYLNCDAGTMNPYQHGEVFVLDDGGEVDLDLGNYERFLSVSLSSEHNITTGKVYKSVIEKERRGEYLGKTVQIIPHITNEIKAKIQQVGESSGAEVMLVELGGTVGDIESSPFLEAVRQLRRETGGEENTVFLHTTLVPELGVVGEQKTKPTQHSVSMLREAGIIPDAIVARATRPLDYEIKRKIALFCDVPLEAVISAPDAKSIYLVPLILEEQGLTEYLVKRLKLPERPGDLAKWMSFTERLSNPRGTVNVALVGKYTGLADSYISHLEAFRHAGAAEQVHVNIIWVEGESVEKHGIPDALKGADAVLVPGGFGDRGTEGKIAAIRYARENNVPFQGVCLGFQLATIEYGRNVLGFEDANSTEFSPGTKHPVVDLLPEQRSIKDMGATMRLGAHDVIVKEGSLAHRIYGSGKISERHRHRYEINPDFVERLERGGLRYSGRSRDGRRMEILELPEHPYFVASQFHPEFKSRPMSPSPIHQWLVKAAMAKKGGI
ncbi:MAG: CTP synthase (glutamine hydrolyzing) [Euryarchaeota archaeon]|nr:CTP synthase (glutamine hydrolyzing) [Euryarchaeota archaeon]